MFRGFSQDTPSNLMRNGDNVIGDPASNASGKSAGVAREEVLESQQERLRGAARHDARREQADESEGGGNEHGHGETVARVPVDSDQGCRHDGSAEPT